jgi:hypothetical protein
MDKMTPFALLTVSLPESILSAIIMVQLIDGRRYLSFKDPHNILKNFLLVLGMMIQTYFVRYFAPNMVVSILIQTIIYVILIKLIYSSFKLKDIIKGVLLYAFIFVAIELIIAIAIILRDGNVNIVYSNDMTRLQFSVIENILQVALILALFALNRVSVFLKEYKRVRRISIFVISLIFCIEVIIIYIFLNGSDIMNFSQKIALCICLLMLFVLNIAIIRLIQVCGNDVFLKCYLSK